MSIPGSASADATRLLAGQDPQLPPSAYRLLGKTGLSVSKIGFGTYRCSQENPNHRQALQHALQNGCNLIDTSANYTDGSSEALIGEVLNEEIVWNGRPRENFVVVSKAGYIQGENLQLARTKEQEGKLFSEIVKYQSELWHCIHPDFLEDQITRSLARMHLDTLDVYLLHNPEYFLLDAHQASPQITADTLNQFYERLRRAFICLEKMVSDGLIQYYGISSNGLPLPGNAPEFVDLGRVWQAYQDACLQLGKSVDEGHFAVLQLPLNWFETAAALVQNHHWQQKPYSVLQMAQRLNLAVLINRPLNAIRQNRLVRLASYGFDPDIDYNARLEHSLHQLQLREQQLQSSLDSLYGAPDALLHQTKQLFNVVAQLQQLAGQYYDISRLRELLQQQFLPYFRATVEASIKLLPEKQSDAAKEHLDAYQDEFSNCCQALIDREDSRNYQQIRHFAPFFDQEVPSLKTRASIAQKALKTLTDTPGVTSVLCGMRHQHYVESALEVMQSSKEVDGLKLLNWR